MINDVKVRNNYLFLRLSLQKQLEPLARTSILAGFDTDRLYFVSQPRWHELCC